MPPKDFVLARRGTLAEWAAKSPSPVLVLGEIGVETDTHRLKCGDGVTAWSSLPYLTSTFDLEDVPVQAARDTDANLSALTDPFLSGQLVYGQTTGKTVIGDGESLYDDLPDLRKQFQNVVTVAKSGKKGSADFICSEYASDKLCLQAAFSYITSMGGGTLVIMGGSYTVPAFLVHSGANITIFGIGKVIFNLSGGDNDPVLKFTGSYLLSTTLAADVMFGDRTINLTHYTSIQKGDLIKIINTDVWHLYDPNPLYTGELYCIKDISSGAVTLNQPLLRTYLQSNTTMRLYRPIRVNLNNITFIGTGEKSNISGVLFSACINSRIENCTFNTIGRRSFAVWGCYGVLVTNCFISGSMYNGTGYGISIANASTDISVTNSTIENCRHTISLGSGMAYPLDDSVVTAFEGLNRGVRIENNYLIGADMPDEADVIDSHPSTIDWIISGNVIYPGTDTNISHPRWGYHACVDGAQFCIFEGNQVYGGGGVKRRPSSVIQSHTIIKGNIVANARGKSLYTNSEMGVGKEVNLDIVGNFLRNCTMPDNSYGNGIEMGTEDYKLVNISNNIIDTCSQNGIYIIKMETGTFDTRLNISNNIFTNIRQDGISVLSKNLSGLIHTKITNNLIINTNQAANNRMGIFLSGVSDTIIDGNSIENTNGTVKYPILGLINSGSPVDNTIIKNNKFVGYTSPVSVESSTTKIYNNVGYITENTGTATILSTTTSIVVSHGLSAAPSIYFAFPARNVGNCWIDTITNTQMTIHCSASPESDTLVSWSAIV